MVIQLTISDALSRAERMIQSGDMQSALEIYSSILQYDASNKIAMEKLSILLGMIQNNKTSQKQPKDPSQSQISELINLFNLSQFSKLEQSCKELLVQFPNALQVINILGATFLKQNKFHEAITSYDKAIQLNSNYADAYNNRGLVFKNIGKYQEALKDFNKAIELNSNHFDAYNNLGLVFQKLGKYEESLVSYEKAIKINPDYKQGYYNMGNILKEVTFTKYDSKIEDILLLLLEREVYVKPIDIVKQTIRLLKFNPILKKTLKENSIKHIEKIDQIIKQLSNIPLLLRLLHVCQIPDLELENIFSAIRANILFSISDINGSSEILKFQEALALQCFLNEYIYNQSKEEIKALENLEQRIKSKVLQNEQPSLVEILCLASYKLLHQYEWCDRLSFPKEFSEVSKRLILEPKEEKRLKDKIPVLNKVTNKTSSKVQKQYEKNPYPRWVNMRLKLEPISISKVIKMNNLKLYNESINQIKVPSILVAGCGTGQQSIDIATTYKNSKVLAVDLSLSSLAYAKRKTQELGITNVEYMQADILELEKLDKQFDIIDCGGVLHHMADPMVGWKVLTDCLKPGGLMRIALYSKLARKDITKIRQEIIEQNIGIDTVSIRAFRDSLIKSKTLHHRNLFKSNDSYSLSEFRDLIFHVQEHQFTLDQIEKSLSELCLGFCSFQQNTTIKESFISEYSDEESFYDLKKWDNFEKKNPQIFGGMYQFWCQKII